MSIDDRSRQELFQRLDDALGPKAAEILMAHLPPVGWAEVATKSDLDFRLAALEDRMNLRFEKLEERIEKVEERVIGRMHAELAAQSRTMIFAMMSLIFTAVLLTYTAGRFS
ncbi:MAG TPA: hypothetical protein VNA57_12195 [Acidimicrobiales bacterium]|nr:hypothetical protein [Acidimicrobiales bacterium]